MSDTFRKVYKQLKPEASNLISEMKCKAEELELLILKIKNRESSVAMTQLETAMMWATKSVVVANEEIL